MNLRGAGNNMWVRPVQFRQIAAAHSRYPNTRFSLTSQTLSRGGSTARRTKTTRVVLSGRTALSGGSRFGRGGKTSSDSYGMLGWIRTI